MKSIEMILIQLILFPALSVSCNSSVKQVQKKTTTADEIIELIKKNEDVVIKNKEIIGDLDLLRSYTTVPVTNFSSQAYVKSAIFFSNCTFKGKIACYAERPNNEIASAVFEKAVSFIDCSFTEEVNFNNNIFHNAANFTNCTFNKDAYYLNVQAFSLFCFDGSTLKGKAFFQDLYLYQNGSFFKTIFDSTCLFQSAFFNGSIQFSNAQFKSYLDMGLCNFNSKSYFNYTKFSNKAIFDKAVFKDNAEFNYSRISNSTFREATFFLQCSFNESSVENTLDLRNTNFLFKKPSFDKVETMNKVLL